MQHYTKYYVVKYVTETQDYISFDRPAFSTYFMDIERSIKSAHKRIKEMENRIALLERSNASYAAQNAFKSIKEAAQYCNCTERTLHRRAKEGVIKKYVSGSKVYFQQNELDQWLKAS